MAVRGFFGVVVAAALWVGCSSDGDEAPAGGAGAGGSAGSSTTSGTICLMTDVKGDVDDNSYVGAALRGIKQVKADYGWTAVTAELQADTTDLQASQAAFKQRLTELAGQKCDLIVAIAALYGAQVVEVAKASPSQRFQALDHVPEPPVDNVWGQGYAVSQATFLAGYVAAGVTKTGKVGTFGGLNIPPIQEFLDGFALGVAHYNAAHGTKVEVLGWDVNGRVGAFIDNFVDVSKGKAKADELLAQGADIIFPVAGGAGYGAGEAVIVKGNAYVIGVDIDWAEQPAYAQVALTSVVKRLDKSVVSAAKAVREGTFTGGNRVATLENGEIDIAPFHQLDAAVPPSVKAELPDLRAKISAGTIKTKP